MADAVTLSVRHCPTTSFPSVRQRPTLSDMAGISFRPTEQTERALVVLMERWRCQRSQAINRAIQDAAEPPEMVTVESPRVDPPSLTKGATVKLAPPTRRKLNPMTGQPFGPIPKGK